MQQAMTAPKESAGLNRLIHLIDYYFSLGGMQMQFNVVSRDTLLRAQANPEKYQNLIVRVAGYYRPHRTALLRKTIIWPDRLGPVRPFKTGEQK